jgi:hypothetical protein
MELVVALSNCRAETDMVAPRLEAAAEYSSKLLVRVTAKHQKVDELHAAVMADEQRIRDAQAEQESVSGALLI